MSFVVRMKKRKKMVFVRVLCVLMIAVLLWFLNWDLMQETLAEDNAYLILGADWRISPAVRLFLLRPEASPHRGGRAGHRLLSKVGTVQTGLPVGDHLQEGKG